MKVNPGDLERIPLDLYLVYKERKAKCNLCGEIYIRKAWNSRYCLKCRYIKYERHKIPENAYQKIFGKPKPLPSPTDISQYAIPVAADGQEWVYRLGIAIIKQAIYDATSDAKRLCESYDHWDNLARNDAIAFILDKRDLAENWFKIICLTCGMEYETIKLAVRTKLEDRR